MAKRHNCPVVLIYAIEPEAESFTVTTYGQTKALCRHAADLGRKFSQAVLGREVEPAMTEPLDVPDDPAIFTLKGAKGA